jgi:hypothetical protein
MFHHCANFEKGCTHLARTEFKFCKWCSTEYKKSMDDTHCRSCDSKNIITIKERLNDTCAACGSYGFRGNCTSCDIRESVLDVEPVDGHGLMNFCCKDCRSLDIHTNRCANFGKRCKNFTRNGFTLCKTCHQSWKAKKAVPPQCHLPIQVS